MNPPLPGGGGKAPGADVGGVAGGEYGDTGGVYGAVEGVYGAVEGVYGDMGVVLPLSTTITLPLVSTILAGECSWAIVVCRLRHAKTAMKRASTI